MKSSESMEKEASIELFLSSVEKKGLKYTNYIGDGDSSSYGMVAQVLKEKYSDQWSVCSSKRRLYWTYTKMYGVELA